MKTIVVNVPDQKENYFIALFKKHRLKPRVLQKEEDEDLIAKWIDEGMESEDVSEEKIFAIFRKNGIKV
ncbi:MAG: hypothetical protein IIA88_02885 [Bacteroidetes bacterium]|nr:hypothetical protein [Bacteroidota bacterium]